MMEFAPVLLSATGLLGSIETAAMAMLKEYTYAGIFVLMVLESASLPIPSEVILPAAGALADRGVINIYLAFAVSVVGSMIGIWIDYFVAYFVGKDVVYKHLNAFRVRKETIDGFDSWFRENGPFAVFISRLVPVIRGLISFPAGFAQMDKRRFFLYSLAGTLAWDALLMTFGYYAIQVKSLPLLVSLIAAFILVLYLVYVTGMRKVSKRARL
jgi:membrane protein DedA with SNARE-associated domain